jgi:hypothetical protein
MSNMFRWGQNNTVDGRSLRDFFLEVGGGPNPISTEQSRHDSSLFTTFTNKTKSEVVMCDQSRDLLLESGRTCIISVCNR